MLQLCLSPTCYKPVKYTVESDRHVQNDQINGQLLLLLQKLQELNSTCAVEQSNESSGNSSFLNVCTTLKIKLQFLTKHISDYVSYQISQCIVTYVCFA